MKYSNLVKDTLTYNDVPSNQMWMQKDEQFTRYSRKSYLHYISPHYNLHLKVNNLCRTLWLIMHHQVWLQKLQTFNNSEDVI